MKAPLLTVLCLAIPSLACAAALPPQSGAPESFDLKRIDSFQAAQALERGCVGLSVALVKNGQVVLARVYGHRSLEPQLPVEPDTLFAIGSVTKQFTCAAVLLLAQDGKLSVRDKVSKYFPKLTRASEITLLDLMNHTSGYPDYYPLDFVTRRMQKTISPDDLIQQFAGGRLDFDPGTRWSYSNTGFILLGRIVEMASGQSFPQFLESRILRPLGMDHTAFAPDPKDKRCATGYSTFALSAAEPASPEGAGWVGAAGALYSTPSDLVKWNLALMSGKLLQPESYRLMITPRELPDGKTTGYGCGLVVGMEEGRTVLRHGGAVSGFHAFNAFIPSTQSALVLLCNTDDGLGSLPDILTSLLLRSESNVPKVAGLAAVDAVKQIFAQFQAGTVQRSHFGEEFNAYLSELKLTGAAQRLKPLAAPHSAKVIRARERGGLEVTTTTLTFENKTLEVLMYRSTNGLIEQFFINEK